MPAPGPFLFLTALLCKCLCLRRFRWSWGQPECTTRRQISRKLKLRDHINAKHSKLASEHESETRRLSEDRFEQPCLGAIALEIKVQPPHHFWCLHSQITATSVSGLQAPSRLETWSLAKLLPPSSRMAARLRRGLQSRMWQAGRMLDCLISLV